MEPWLETARTVAGVALAAERDGTAYAADWLQAHPSLAQIADDPGAAERYRTQRQQLAEQYGFDPFQEGRDH